MRTGQLITSFLQGKANLIMTSTTSNHYAEAATEESKTGYYSESPGETLDTNNPLAKTGGHQRRGGRYKGLRYLNDLLPYNLRPIKAKRRRARVGYGWRMELYTFRMTWRSHKGPAIRRKIQSIKEKIQKIKKSFFSAIQTQSRASIFFFTSKSDYSRFEAQ